MQGSEKNSLILSAHSFFPGCFSSVDWAATPKRLFAQQDLQSSVAIQDLLGTLSQSVMLSVLWFVGNSLAKVALFSPSCDPWPISQDVGPNGSLPLCEMPSPEYA